MAGTRVFPHIKEIRAYVTDSVRLATQDQGADCHDVEDEHWINGYPTPVANPMSVHPMYAATRKSWGINALGTMVVEVCKLVSVLLFASLRSKTVH